MRTPSSTRPTFLFVAIIAVAVISAATAPSRLAAGMHAASRPPQQVDRPPERQLPERPPPERQLPEHGQPSDVAPMEINLSAYRLDRLVIVSARGSNRTGGYTTRLESGAPDATPPKVYLRNIPPPRGTLAPQAITPFDIAAYFSPAGEPEQIEVLIAGRPTLVKVKPIEEMQRSTDFNAQPSSPAPASPRR